MASPARNRCTHACQPSAAERDDGLVQRRAAVEQEVATIRVDVAQMQAGFGEQIQPVGADVPAPRLAVVHRRGPHGRASAAYSVSASGKLVTLPGSWGGRRVGRAQRPEGVIGRVGAG